MKNTQQPPEGKNNERKKGGMTRREFAIRLGAGAGASIIGFILTGKDMAAKNIAADPAGITARPELSGHIVFGTCEKMISLQKKNAPHSPLCVVNDTGAEILRMLDGRQTIPEISHRVAAKLELPPDESLSARIAYFIVQVSQLGFLKKPYYACIYENRIS